ncbi:hypothetical protein LT493_18700 [Streptomyces tricolor]|nr:hypothetical protein [Streptomyces tricolor]
MGSLTGRADDMRALSGRGGDPNLRPFLDALAYAVPEPNGPGAQQAKSLLRQNIEALWTGQRSVDESAAQRPPAGRSGGVALMVNALVPETAGRAPGPRAAEPGAGGLDRLRAAGAARPSSPICSWRRPCCSSRSSWSCRSVSRCCCRCPAGPASTSATSIPSARTTSPRSSRTGRRS